MKNRFINEQGLPPVKSQASIQKTGIIKQCSMITFSYICIYIYI